MIFLKLIAPFVALIATVLQFFLDDKWHDKRTKEYKRGRYLLLFSIIITAIVSGVIIYLDDAGSKGLDYQLGRIQGQNDSLKTLITQIQENTHQERKALESEIKNLNSSLEPFRLIAERRFSNVSRSEALSKLAERIEKVESQVKDVDRLREIASKHEFKPINKGLYANIVKLLLPISSKFKSNEVVIEISYETWALPPTRQFADQLANMLKESGFEVHGPNFVTVYLVSKTYPLEWGYNESQYELINELYSVLRNIIKPNINNTYAKRNNFQKGSMRIHFAGSTIFDDEGRVSVE